MTLAEKIIAFNQALTFEEPLPEGILHCKIPFPAKYLPLNPEIWLSLPIFVHELITMVL